MPSAAPHDRSKKGDILRAVYEANLRDADPAAAPPRPPVRPRHPVVPAPPPVFVTAPRPTPRPVEEAKPSPLLTPLVFVFSAVALVLLGLVVDGFRSSPSRDVAFATTAQATNRPAILIPGGHAVPGGEVLGDPSRVAVADLFNLHVNTIVIDAGHGGHDPGALGAEGTQEKDITLDLARRLRDRLQARDDYQILMTRESDRFVALGDRVTFANERAADLFVSIHINWLPDEDVAPLETYYFGMRGDATALQLAHGENSTSEYSVAEFNQMLQRAGNTVKFEESRDLAEAIQGSLLTTVRQTNADVSDWGVKAGPFVVLLGVDAPAVLAEVAALSNPDEESRLHSDAHREALARALEEGIVAYLDSRPLASAPLAHTPTPKTRHGRQEEN